MPAEDRLDRLVDRAVERVDRPVAGRLGAALLAGHREARPCPVALPPCDDVTLQPSRTTEAGTSAVFCSTSASRSASVTSFLASASAIACAVDRVEPLALDLVAELAQLALQPAPAGQLADRQLAAGQPDRLGGHDLVGQRVLDDAVLVDAALVGERVAADDRLVRLDGEPGEVADEPAGGGELLGRRRPSRARGTGWAASGGP